MQPAASNFAEPQPMNSSIAKRPGVVIALRILAVLVGIAGALTALFFAGLVAVFSTCDTAASALCRNYAGLVAILEWAIGLVAVAAPLAGGIATCCRREWGWLATGLTIGFLMVLLMFLVADAQSMTLA